MSGWLTQGPRVAEFERAVADYCGTPHAVAVSNCTTALHLAMLLHGIGPGDEVICPSMSFIATANAIRYTGAAPVFAEVDRLTYNLDPAAAEAAITPRTKAIIAVHQIGLPADMDRFYAIGTKYGLKDPRGRRLRHRQPLPRPADRRQCRDSLFQLPSAQGHHDRRRRNDYDKQRRFRATAATLAAARHERAGRGHATRQVVIESTSAWASTIE